MVTDQRVQRFEIWRGKDGWRVRLVAGENGEVLLSSEAYRDKRAAEAVVDRVRFPPEHVEVVITDRDRMTVLGGDVLTTSELNDAVGVPDDDPDDPDDAA